ncbi:hypothetical protein J4Q44_G00173080 [Coregonus suidteri]|uniref:AN1-type domain-containing protein n=1 Tax=Coregonus suidteri TaxID=861788 RepID=A0AAN8QPA7_9TELE
MVRKAHHPAERASELGMRWIQYPAVHHLLGKRKRRLEAGDVNLKIMQAVWLNQLSGVYHHSAMEFPDLGEHCSENSCKQLDFLPMRCDACEEIFCKDHISYANHKCMSSYKKDVQVPVRTLLRTRERYLQTNARKEAASRKK